MNSALVSKLNTWLRLNDNGWIDTVLVLDVITALEQSHAANAALREKLAGWKKRVEELGLALDEEVSDSRLLQAEIEALRKGAINIVLKQIEDGHVHELVEIEDLSGRSIRIGSWLKKDGFTYLTIYAKEMSAVPEEPQAAVDARQCSAYDQTLCTENCHTSAGSCKKLQRAFDGADMTVGGSETPEL